ncbi:hypothetical protein CL656_07160 [bacterium]|nr:hypothetical protein [bacterium]|tara:strand:- start:620 stop:1729 length:1110 start_codon:yes stop_codon:yes gene_type:complete
MIKESKTVFIVMGNWDGGGPSYLAEKLLSFHKDVNRLIVISIRKNNKLYNLCDNLTKKKIQIANGFFQSYFLLFNSFLYTYINHLFIKKVNKSYVISFDNVSNIYAFFLKVLIRSYWICTLHGFKGPLHGRYRIINSFILRFVNISVTNSNGLSDHIKKHFRFLNPIKISLGIDIFPKLKEAKSLLLPKTKDESIRIIHLANFYSNIKGHKKSLLLSKKLKDNGYNNTLSFVGDGHYKKKIQHDSLDLGLEDNVIFHGFLENEDKYNVIKSCHVGISPSDSEAFGLASLENMNFGLPIIGSNIPGQNEVILDNINGLLFKSDDIDDFYHKFMLLLTKPLLYQKLSKGALKTSSEFTSIKMIENYRELIL